MDGTTTKISDTDVGMAF